MELSVCIGSACHIKGSYNVIQTLQQLVEEYALHEKVELKAAFCMKKCAEKGVSVTFDGAVYGVEPAKAAAFFRETVLPAVGK